MISAHSDKTKLEAMGRYVGTYVHLIKNTKVAKAFKVIYIVPKVCMYVHNYKWLVMLTNVQLLLLTVHITCSSHM